LIRTDHLSIACRYLTPVCLSRSCLFIVRSGSGRIIFLITVCRWITTANVQMSYRRFLVAEYANKWWTFRRLSCDWTRRSILTSRSNRPSVVAGLVASRGRTWGRAAVLLRQKKRRIKLIVVVYYFNKWWIHNNQFITYFYSSYSCSKYLASPIFLPNSIFLSVMTRRIYNICKWHLK